MLPGAGSECGSLTRRPYIQTPDSGNVRLPFSSFQSLPKPQFPDQSGVLPVPSVQDFSDNREQLQELNTLQATISQIPQLNKPDNPLPQNFNQAQICGVQSDTTKLNITAGGTEAKEMHGFRTPSMINSMNAKLDHNASMNLSSHLTSVSESNEKEASLSHRNPEDHVNPVACLNQNPIPSQFQAGLSAGQPPLGVSNSQLQPTTVPICDSISPDGFVPLIDNSEWIPYLSGCQSADGFAKSQDPSTVFGIQDQAAAIPPSSSAGQDMWEPQWNKSGTASQVNQLPSLPQLDPSSFSCISNAAMQVVFKDLLRAVLMPIVVEFLCLVLLCQVLYWMSFVQ